MRFATSAGRRTLCGVLLAMLGPASLAAQGRLAVEPSPVPPASGCVIVASVLGGFAGAFVGAAAGVLVERAFYRSNPEAGFTGFAVGLIFGTLGGVQVARKACDEPEENPLRGHHWSGQARLGIPGGGEPWAERCARAGTVESAADGVESWAPVAHRWPRGAACISGLADQADPTAGQAWTASLRPDPRLGG